MEVHPHRQRFGVALEIGADVGERIAEQPGGLFELGHRILDQLGVVPVALLDRQRGRQLLVVEVADVAVDGDVAELVALTLFDHVGDDEVALVGRQFGDRAGHAEIGIALRQIELAQLLLIVVQAILVVRRVRRQQAEPARFLRRHLAAQLAVLEHLVADDVDLADLGLGAFVDFEHHVDAVLVEVDHLRRHDRGEAALAAVQFEDAADVLPHCGAREDLTRRELDLFRDLVALQRLVALQDHAVDDRVLAHLQHDVAGLHAVDLILHEQVGGLEILQRLVERFGGVGNPDAQLGIGQHRLGLDALRPFDAQRLDRTHRLGCGRLPRRRGRARGRGCRRGLGRRLLGRRGPGRRGRGLRHRGHARQHGAGEQRGTHARKLGTCHRCHSTHPKTVRIPT